MRLPSSISLPTSKSPDADSETALREAVLKSLSKNSLNSNSHSITKSQSYVTNTKLVEQERVLSIWMQNNEDVVLTNTSNDSPIDSDDDIFSDYEVDMEATVVKEISFDRKNTTVVDSVAIEKDVVNEGVLPDDILTKGIPITLENRMTPMDTEMDKGATIARTKDSYVDFIDLTNEDMSDEFDDIDEYVDGLFHEKRSDQEENDEVEGEVQRRAHHATDLYDPRDEIKCDPFRLGIKRIYTIMMRMAVITM